MKKTTRARPRGVTVARVLAGILILPVLLAVGGVAVLRFGISDAQKARWATQVLEGAIPGRVALGGLHWEFPAAVTLHDVQVWEADAKEDAAPVISAREATAHLWLAALTEHRIALTDVHVADANVVMTQRDSKSEFDLVTAFVPPTPENGPSKPEAEPWMVSLDDIGLHNVSFTLQRPDMKLHIRDAAAHDGAFWLRGESMGVSAELRADVTLHAGDTRLHVQALGVAVKQGVWRMHEDDWDVGVDSLRVEAQQNVVDTTGHLQWGSAALRAVDAKADVRLDTASELLRGQLPRALRRALHGKAAVQASLKGDGDGMDYTLDVGGQPDTPAPRVGEMPLDALHVAGNYNKGTLKVARFALDSGKAHMDMDGHVVLEPDKDPDKPMRLGEHALHLKAHNIPLARALGPFMDTEGVLPEQVDVQLESGGDSLWPPRNTAFLRMSVRGVPKKFVGVPDPLEIDSALAGKGTKIHIEHFTLRGEDTDFALEGDIPLHPDDVMDVLGQLKQMKAGKTLKRLKVPLGAREVRLRTRVTGTFAHPRAEGTLWAVDITAQDHVMQLEAPFGWEDDRLMLRRAVLSLRDGRAEVSGQLVLGERPEMTLQASLKNVAAAASGLPLTGQVDGTVTANGPLAAPLANAKLTWHEAGWQKSPGRAEVFLTAQSDTRGMHLEKLEVVPTGGGYSRIKGDVLWDTQHVDLVWDADQVAAAWLARAAGAGADLDARGVLQAHGHVTGTPRDAKGEAKLTLAKAGVGATDVGDVVVDIHGDTQQVTATVTTAKGSSRVALESNVWLPNAEHPLRAAGKVHLAPVSMGDFLPGVTAQATDAQVAAEGQWSWHAAAGLHASVEISRLDARVGNKKMALERPAHLRWRDGEASIDDLHLSGDLASLWLRGRWGKQIGARADGRLDLRVLSDFVPAFGSAEGTMSVALTVEGTPQHPDAHGKLKVTSPVVVRLRQVPGEIYIDRGVVTLTPAALAISDWRGRYGFGALEIDGRVGLKNLQPDTYNVNLRATDIPCRTPELLLEMSADVHVAGAGAQPLIQGKIDITRGRYIKRFDLHDFYVQAKPGPSGVALKDKAPGLERVGLDVRVGTSNELVVNVDAGLFAVKTDLQANLHITGNAVYPKINGSLRAEGGTLKFPEASLTLTEANLDFTPGAGHAIDAKVHMLGEGTVNSSGANSQAYAVTLALDGDLDKMALDLRATPDRTRLEVLSLLTTGHADLSELVQQSPDDSKLNAALVFAGSQVSEPVTRYASAQIERYAKLKVDLGAQVTQDSVTLTASKQVMSRLRLQGAYQHGIGTDSAAVVAGAQVALTDKLFFEGTQTLPTANANTVDNYAQGSLQLKWRLLGH